MNAFSKALITLSVGVLMIIGLSVLIPEMIVGIIAGYSIGIISLVLTSELID